MIDIVHTRLAQRGDLRLTASMPFIYGMIIPLWGIDVSFRFYQAVCFPLFGIGLVERARYVKPWGRDVRAVTIWDRYNCWYCGYANGVISYVRAILIETEKYWCPIKYQTQKGFVAPHAQSGYVEPHDEAALSDLISTKREESL